MCLGVYFFVFSIRYIKRNSVWLCICFYSSETAISSSIKLGTVDHQPVVSVIRVFVTSS